MSNMADEGLSREAEAQEQIDEAPSFDELVTLGMQDLYERLITVENVLVDVIVIVSDKADQPATMRNKLRKLLVPNESQSEKPAAPPDDPSYHTKF